MIVDELPPFGLGMMSIVDEHHVVVSATPSFMNWIGRSPESVIGQSTRCWYQLDDWAASDVLFQDSLRTGLPCSWQRRVVRLDGSMVAEKAVSVPVFSGLAQPAAICLHEALAATQQIGAPRSIDVADYISAMARQLAGMAAVRGMGNLSYMLSVAAKQAKAVQSGPDPSQ